MIHLRILLPIALLFVVTSCFSQVTFGKFVLFVPVEETTIQDSCLGTLIGRADGTLNLKTGAEAATIEFYSFNNDAKSDLYVIRRKNGRLVSLGLDSTGSQYLQIIETFHGLIEPDDASNYDTENRQKLQEQKIDTLRIVATNINTT